MSWVIEIALNTVTMSRGDVISYFNEQLFQRMKDFLVLEVYFEETVSTIRYGIV